MRRWGRDARLQSRGYPSQGDQPVSISGSLTAAACISYPSLPDAKFATDTRLPAPPARPERPLRVRGRTDVAPRDLATRPAVSNAARRGKLKS